VFANIRAPLQHDFNETRLGSKTGKATVVYVHEPLLTNVSLAWGDASIEAAAEEGAIKAVRHADYELLNVLGLYVRFTTYAYGD
jgi:hypothetical protein